MQIPAYVFRSIISYILASYNNFTRNYSADDFKHKFNKY